MPHLHEHHGTWMGRTVTDASGHKIGKIDDVYTDDDTGQPEWLAVATGVMGSNVHFVPMRGATVSGGGVQVPHPKDRVKVAPSVGADSRLSRMEKGRLYAHYGYSYAEERNRLQRALGADLPGPSGAEDRHDVRRPVDLRQRSVPAEALDVSRPAGRRDEPGPQPPGGGRRASRGRWPDDEAIFGLSQEAAPPTLAASGEPGRR